MTKSQDSPWNTDENQAKVVWRPVAICSQSELRDEGQDQIPDHYWARQGNSQSFSRKLCFFLKVMVFSDILQIVCISTWMAPTQVWMPDTFFRNEKIGRFHNILQPNLYVRVFPNGDVLYSIRVSLTCACSMHLALFPLDKQTCNLDVASCKY